MQPGPGLRYVVALIVNSAASHGCFSLKCRRDHGALGYNVWLGLWGHTKTIFNQDGFPICFQK